MGDYTNRTFDEIEIGAAEKTVRAQLHGHRCRGPGARRRATSRAFTSKAASPGDEQPHRAGRGGRRVDRRAAQPAASGPGQRDRRHRISTTRGSIRVGDTLTATVTATRQEREAAHDRLRMPLHQPGRRPCWSTAWRPCAAPTERIAYSNLATPEMILRHNDGFAKLFGACAELAPVTCAVVHPCDRDSLRRRDRGRAARSDRPGAGRSRSEDSRRRAKRGRSISRRFGSSRSSTATPRRRRRWRWRARAKSSALMKGSLHTDELMGAVVPSATGLRTARGSRTCSCMDVPDLSAPAARHRCGDQHLPRRSRSKADICQNAIDLAHMLGIAEPKVAILSAVETVNPKIPSTLDAAALCKMADRGQITGGVLDGPLAFDNAISVEAARTKRIVLDGRRPRRHPARARPRSRQHDGEAAAVSRRRRFGRHRAAARACRSCSRRAPTTCARGSPRPPCSSSSRTTGARGSAAPQPELSVFAASAAAARASPSSSRRWRARRR